MIINWGAFEALLCIIDLQKGLMGSRYLQNR